MASISRRAFLGRAVATGAAVAGVGWAQRAGAGDCCGEKPNIVFILIDDLGWADIGCYGSTFYRTPNIDRLASQGVRFTNAYAACPVCSPTRASVLTGKYPARLHLTDWIPGHKRPEARLRVPEFNQQLPYAEVTIAEALRPAGYVSGAFGKWHLGDVGYWPEQQGFDVNFAGYHKGQPPSYFSPYNIPNAVDGPKGEYLTDRTTDEALAFIEANQGNPFFLYLPHYAVHTPLQAKADLVAEYEAARDPEAPQNNAKYAAMIESVDQSVGRIMAKLDELGIAGKTVVFFTGDNGGLEKSTSNAPLREGKGTLYEGGIREPLIVRWPGETRPGSVCHAPVSSVDFFPTILAMARRRNTVAHIDGIDLVPWLRGRELMPRRALYWHYPHYHPCGATPGGIIRVGDYKLIEYYEDGRLELYNLREDIGEQNNLIDVEPRRAARLRRRLHRWLKAVDAQMPTPNPDWAPGA